VDTLLTLVVALGGIATGIGAIWTTMLAKRQLSEQRQSSREQTEIARRQAQVTERSLAEQNERARLTLEYDLLTRMVDRFGNPHLQRSRRATAKYLLENAFVDDEVIEAPYVDNTASDVCTFFEEVGEMVRLGILSAESVTNRFSAVGQAYWILCRAAIEKACQEWELPTLYKEFEYLSRLMAALDRERGDAPSTQEHLRQLMEWEAVVGEEPFPTAE
jgi:hypothetical protein